MLVEDFELGFTLSSDRGSYNRLCLFGNAMRWGYCIPISDEDIRKGVDYEKARMKVTLRIIDNGLGREISPQEKAIIDNYCENCYFIIKNLKDRCHKNRFSFI